MISKKQKENEIWQELIFGLTSFIHCQYALDFQNLCKRAHDRIILFMHFITLAQENPHVKIFWALSMKYPFFFSTVSTFPKSSLKCVIVEGAPCFF